MAIDDKQAEAVNKQPTNEHGSHLHTFGIVPVVVIGVIVVFALLVFIRTAETPQAINYADDQEVQTARSMIADELSVNNNDVTIKQVEDRVYNDACLELPKENEECAQIRTEGIWIEVDIKDTTYIFHSNSAGTIVREAPVNER